MKNFHNDVFNFDKGNFVVKKNKDLQVYSNVNESQLFIRVESLKIFGTVN